MINLDDENDSKFNTNKKLYFLNIQNRDKLVDQKEWFVMCSYITKHKSAHDCKIVECLFFQYFSTCYVFDDIQISQIKHGVKS